MKNFKLLLATTAILSTGAILTTFAGTAQDPQASVKVYVDLANPVTINAPVINFGVLDMTQGGFIKYVDENIDDSSTAVILGGPLNTGAIDLSGGIIGKMIERGKKPSFILPAKITLKDGSVDCGDFKIDKISDATVIDGNVYTSYIDSTFTIKQNLSSEAYLHCTGTANVTVVLSYDVDID